jgi:hypothetical protein
MDDRSELSSLVGALAVHVDGRQWDDVLELLAGDVEVDYTSLFGGERRRVTREMLVGDWRRLLPGFTRTTHVVGAPAVVVDGDRAQVSASIAAWHFIDEPALDGRSMWFVSGCWELVFTKQDGTWRIAALTLARASSQGNGDLPRLASERAARAAEA